MGYGIIHANAVIVQTNTAQDGGIDLIVQRNGLSGDRGKLAAEFLLLRIGQGYGGNCRYGQDAVILIVVTHIAFAAVGEMADIAVFRKDLQEIQQIGVYLIPEALVQDLAALCLGQGGGSQQPDKIRFGTEAFIQHLQLLQDLMGQMFILCQLQN